MNINRDYLIINDVKKSNIKLDNGSMFFYITDKNTQNIFVNLVINISNNELIQKYANIENAEDYTLTMNIVKPSNTYKVIEGKLHDKEKAIFEFNLNEDCCDEIGTYRCELLTKCNIDNHEEITTSNKLTYKVKSSVLNDLDDIVEAPEYPLVIQLFDKLSDIEQYEEDRRANELARQLAEEQRQAKHDELVSDMTDSIQAMDNKVVEVENRIAAKEQAVDKLVTDTKADIDEYKVAKDREIDEYKAAKDTEINNAITAQDNKIDEAISAQNDRITVVENNDVVQNDRLDIVENKNTQQDNRLTTAEAKNVEQDNRLNTIEAIDVAQNNRLDAIEAKNTEQDDRLLDIEKVNKRQDMNLKCLFAESKNNMIDVTEEGNSIYLQNSTTGYTLIDEIKGNTLVNCNKEPDKELILNGNINTSGDNTVTLTEGVDGGLVDVALEGNTLVNVSKTKDSTAISKSYIAENSGNHIALQGNTDGSCKPVITGNTLVNLFNETNFEKSSYADLVYWDGNILRTSSQAITSERGNFVLLRYVGSILKQDTVYTFVIRTKGTFTGSIFGDNFVNQINNEGDGIHKIVFTYNGSTNESYRMWVGTSTPTNLEVEFLLLLEGDYTDKPIPDYFEGLQSTFEDNLVTQEMVDNGEEEVGNLGKYKVEYKVTGKNKLNLPSAFNEWDGGKIAVTDGNIVTFTPNDRGTQSMTYNTVFTDVNFKKGTQLTLSATKVSGVEYTLGTYAVGLSLKDVNGNEISDIPNTNCPDFTINSPVGTTRTTTMTLTQDVAQIGLFAIAWGIQGASGDTVFKLQLEYGDTATSYEPYKGYTKTLYLNSPLLKGDTIEEKDGGIYHIHRYKSRALNGSDDEGWVYWNYNTELSNDLISFYLSNIDNYIECRDNMYCDKFICYLTVWGAQTECIALNGDSAIRLQLAISRSKLPTQDVEGFKQWLQQNPVTVVYQLASPTYELIEQSNLVIPSYTNGHLDFNTAIPAEKVDFLPFSEELTYLYANTQYTIQFISNTTITADITLGGTSLLAQSIVAGLNRISITTPATLANNKLIIDGVGAKISEVVVTDTNKEFMYFEGMTSVGEGGNLVITSSNSDNSKSNTQQLTHEPLRVVRDVKDRYVLIDGKWYIERNCRQENMSELKFTGDTSNTMKCLILFKSKPKAISNIFSNSRGYESATKGQMYVQERGDGITYLWIPTDPMSREEFTNFLNEKNATIVYAKAEPTYEPIDYNPLEVYSGTTHITTNSTIPANIIVKNHGYNCLLKPSTTYTISSNLGLNTVTTPSTLTEDCLRFMDTDTSDVTTMKNVLVLEGDWTTKADLIPTNFSGIESAFEQEYDTEKGKYKVNVKVANEDKSKENNITFYINEPLRGIGDVKDRVFIKDDKVVVQRNCGIRPYEDGDFGTYPTDKVDTVYPLAEPVYEEVEYNNVKLFIESFKNSTLFYNSNVPVTSAVHYSYSVPIVDTVAQTASISDEQDNMIIDLATQVAVMEMMLM